MADPTPPFPSDGDVVQRNGNKGDYRSEETLQSHQGPKDRREGPPLRPDTKWWD
jgi:hypothetical protein